MARRTEPLKKLYWFFWTDLLRRADRTTVLYQGIRACRRSYIHLRPGPTGVNFATCVATRPEGVAWVELCLETSSAERNALIYGDLEDYRLAIGAAYGGELDWDGPTPGRARCKIMARKHPFQVREDSSWAGMQDCLIAEMVRLYSAIVSSPASPVWTS